MNLRIQHRKLLIGMFFLFLATLVFASSVKGQETPVTITPLSIVSIFQQPKQTPPNSNNPDSSQSNLPENSGDNTVDHGIPVPFPQPDIAFEKVCDPTTVAVNEEIFCTITIINNDTEAYTYKILDLTSPRLTVREDSLEGATLYKDNLILQRGTLAGATLPALAIDDNDTPLAYNSLGAFGIPPLTDVQDEAIINLSTLEPFVYNGQEYSHVGMTSNGYLTAGLGSDEDISYTPQIFPDPAIPNNVIAPFWTDLNPEAGGNLYAALLTRDDISWIVLEWEDVPAFAGEKPSPNCTENCVPLYTFQVWIETNTTEQAITFIYVQTEGADDITELTIGAEDSEGLIGANYGLIPLPEDELMVVSTPGTEGESHVISYTAEANRAGHWYGCALAKVHQVRGISFDCEYGTITE